jgi:hypothetical protein
LFFCIVVPILWPLQVVPPDDYRAFSWDSTKQSAAAYAEDWFDRTWLKPMRPGVSVHLEEGDHKSVELTLIEPGSDAAPTP